MPDLRQTFGVELPGPWLGRSVDDDARPGRISVVDSRGSHDRLALSTSVFGVLMPQRSTDRSAQKYCEALTVRNQETFASEHDELCTHFTEPAVGGSSQWSLT